MQYAACLSGFFFFLFGRGGAGGHNSIPITLVGRVLQSTAFLQVSGIFHTSLPGRAWDRDTTNLLVEGPMKVVDGRLAEAGVRERTGSAVRLG